MGSEGEHHLRFIQSRKWNAYGRRERVPHRHMVFSRDEQLRCPHVTSTTDKCSRVPADRIRILGRD